MKRQAASSSRFALLARAFTLVEVMIVVFVGSLLLAVVAILGLYAARSFEALGNYADLDIKSRYAVDTITKEIRQASLLMSFSNSPSFKSLTFSNSDPAAMVTYAWDANAGTITCARSGQPLETNLSGCTAWSFSLYQRTPTNSFSTNIIYYPATNAAGALTPSICKLIDMSWTCTRTNYAMRTSRRLNTESIQTAQVVLRNKQ